MIKRREDVEQDSVQKIIRVLPLWQYLMGLITACAMFLLGAGMTYQKLQGMQDSIINLTLATRSAELQQAKQDRINSEYRDWLIRHDKEIDRINDRR